jgi:hypothetical protein
MERLPPKRLKVAVLALLVLTCCIPCGVMAYVQRRSSIVSKAPPPYPDSELISRWESGGPTSVWDRRTYRTDDSVEQVLEFMEQHMPGFSETQFPEGLGYKNKACDTGWSAYFVAWAVASPVDEIEGLLPTVSVWFYSDSENPSGTIINIWFVWPSL